MSQRARALVERLKRETSHLPGNTPAQNKALETICQILDESVEPLEEVDEVEEPAGEPEPAAEAEATDESGGDPAAEESGEEGEDGPSGMTTQNSPT